jgi:hypothetical protein
MPERIQVETQKLRNSPTEDEGKSFKYLLSGSQLESDRNTMVTTHNTGYTEWNVTVTPRTLYVVKC